MTYITIQVPEQYGEIAAELIEVLTTLKKFERVEILADQNGAVGKFRVHRSSEKIVGK